MEFSQEELLRYNRQMLIPEIGEEGQRRLRAARVLVAGVGGLGSLSSYYLTAAGVGNIRIIDKDIVDYSNLNRQILHWTDNVGELKTESASRKLKALNPHCTIEAVTAEINAANCMELVGNSELIVDAMDNMAARRILNATSVRKGIPYIYGGVNQLDGLVTTFIPGKTPCLECLFPANRGESKTVPPAVLGAVPGVIACIQAMEAVKFITGMEGLLTGRLLCFSGYDMTFRELKIPRDPRCAVCGTP